MPTSPCPTCGKPVTTAKSDRPGSFPFCTDRCRLVDLGKWFDEEHRISTPIESPEQIQELLEELEDGPARDQPGIDEDEDS